MSEQTQQNHNKNHKAHDNCQNCVRQKKENEAFIKIYEKLQEIQLKTKNVRQAVDNHKKYSEKSRIIGQKQKQKSLSLPKVRKQLDHASLENIGFDLACSIYEKQSKKSVVEENKRLKAMITKLQSQKWGIQRQLEDYKDLRRSQRTSVEPRYKNIQMLNNSSSLSLHKDRLKNQQQSQAKVSNQGDDISNADKQTQFQQSRHNFNDNSSTKSSSFHTEQLGGSMNMSKYSDMNLWLYENEKHAKLQSQLYIPRTLKNQSFVSSNNSYILPTIRRHK